MSVVEKIKSTEATPTPRDAVSQHAVSQEAAGELLRAAADWTWSIDAAGRLTVVSSGLTRLLGRPARTVLGRQLADLGALVQPDADDVTATRAFQGRRPFRDFALALVDASGRQRLQRLAGVPVYEAETGAFQGYQGIAQDQSESRPVEHRIAHDRAQLDCTLEKLRSRNAALSDSLTAARAADTAKTRFLAQMSHELRTPLNGIIAYADAVSAGVIPARPEKYVEIIGEMGRAGQHLLAMISDVLDLAGIEHGTLRLHPEAVAVGPAVAEAFGMVRMAMERKGIDTSAVDTDAEAVVEADRRRVVQILINLLQNAVKYGAGENGTVGIEVQGPKASDDVTGGCVDITVWDDGPGIPPDKQEQIFDAFSRLSDEAAAQKAEGLGLGLAVSRQLVREMGGDLWVASSPAGGAAFTIRLPEPKPSE